MIAVALHDSLCFFLLKEVGNIRVYKPVYTTEKLGTDPSRKEYGPHIFARRANYAYNVF